MADENTNEGNNEPNPLEDKLKAEIANAKKQRERAQTAEAERDEFRSRLEALESDKRKAEEAAEQAKLEGQGEYEKALAKQRQSMQEKLEAATARTTAVEDALRKVLGSDSLKTQLGSAGVKPELIGQAAKLLQSQVNVEFADGKSSVTVLDSEGQPMFVEGNPASLADLVKSFTAENLHFMPPTGDTGTGNHAGGGAGGVTIEDLDGTKGATQKFIAEHGTEEYLKLARKTTKPKD